ncbi:MAG: hypothetical protein AAGA55_04285 [Planctomycetota bacterium]
MKLIMDGQTVADDVAGVAQAIDLAREKSAEVGRLIIEVTADGASAEALLETPPADDAGVVELGVVTASKGAFLAETLHDAGDALDRVRIDQKQAADLIDRGEVAEATASLGGVMEGWQAVRTVVEQASALMGVDLHSFEVDGTGAAETITGFASDLVGLRDAVSNEDWSALGDVLAFDLEQRAESWKVLLDGLIAHARSGDEAG